MKTTKLSVILVLSFPTNVFAQSISSNGVSLMSFVPMILIIGTFGITAHLLAKEKGRNVTLWTILGCIPLINMFFIWFFIGAANLKLEKKIDQLLEQQK